MKSEENVSVNGTIDTARLKAKQFLYYIIIGLVSLITLIFLPMVGSTAGLKWAIPTTVVGWIVWIALKLIVAGLNVLIFHCFVQQGKLNVKDNAKFLEAKELLNQLKDKEEIPLSPNQWHKRTYGTKAITVFVTTALGTVALSQAILTFDWMSLLTYLFTIIMGVIFGILQMKSTEEWWTDDYLKYANWMVKNQANKSPETGQKQTKSDDLNIHLTEEQFVENTIQKLTDLETKNND